MRVGIVMDFAAKELGIKREEVEDRIRTIITLVGAWVLAWGFHHANGCLGACMGLSSR